MSFEVVMSGPQARSDVEPCTADASVRVAKAIAFAWQPAPRSG